MLSRILPSCPLSQSTLEENLPLPSLDNLSLQRFRGTILVHSSLAVGFLIQFILLGHTRDKVNASPRHWNADPNCMSIRGLAQTTAPLSRQWYFAESPVGAVQHVGPRKKR